jgi:hypothetical protein
MTKTVSVPKHIPIAPFWFETVQFAWGKAPGPQWPRHFYGPRS